MNIFDSLKTFGGNWKVKSQRPFTEEEIAAVNSASVVASQYGSSICFLMKSGITHYIPLSNTSNLNVGDPVDISKASLLTLSREGSKDINRVAI